ncbi:hypothetical protein IW492_00380 [Enterococcus sp. BWB1-3]|uniref:hypothetical protein n=1 Tax=unclassified Enterococcus TaxID=2608891 RepID=UPI001922E1E6|nr:MULTISPECIES: hypothetical protein [unclassified Enterococcus]MBL1227685.1 hypothetical protein [Enterococcus sp. BWB1-3]MCB5952128.1 hypothetical protein [Enterococcus sp. BWT-B8]MCB5954465.1 hypothetical protein [Enterococcus sp. CWB-B31]
MWVWFILFFVIVQAVLEKKLLPEKLTSVRLRTLCLYSIGGISLAIVLGIIAGQPILIVGTTTIFFGSLVSWKNRDKFDKMERGKRI